MPIGTGASGAVKQEIEEREEEKKEPDAKCIVLFRPDTDYKGEFGFDWLRNGIPDSTISYKDYATTIEGGYGTATSDLGKSAAYAKFKNEYTKIRINGTESVYHVPYLNLFSKTYSDTVEIVPPPPYKAKLRVFVEIKDADVDEIRLEFDKSVFEIDGNKDKGEFALPDRSICSRKVSATITIECIRDITDEKEGEIFAYAYPKDSLSKSEEEQKKEKKLVGKLLVGKNDETVRKDVKLVMICIKTAMKGAEHKRTGKWEDYEVEKIRNIFYQALVRPQIWLRHKDDRGVYKNIILDLTNDPDFLPMGKYVDEYGDLIKSDWTMKNMIKDFTKKFFAIQSNSIYKGWIPIYVMEEPFWDAAGFTDSDYDASGNIIRFAKQSVSFKPRNKDTIPHEIMHGFELFHTHRDGSPPIKFPNVKYLFPHAHSNPTDATDNIMSYQTERNLTWKWQWNILRKNLRK